MMTGDAYFIMINGIVKQKQPGGYKKGTAKQSNNGKNKE